MRIARICRGGKETASWRRAMQLYRFMADVRAGPEQTSCVPGQQGIVTIWVRADSEAAACARAQQVIQTRKYASTGELAVYLEDTKSIEPAADSPRKSSEVDEPTTGSGYQAIKQAALDRGDGLFEAWFPAPPQQADESA